MSKTLSHKFNKIEKETGQRNFIYRIAVTKIKEDRNDYLSKILDNKKIKERFKKHNSEIKVEIIELKKIIEETLKRVEKKETTALEMTEVGRFVQLLKAANIDIK